MLASALALLALALALVLALALGLVSVSVIYLWMGTNNWSTLNTLEVVGWEQIIGQLRIP